MDYTSGNEDLERLLLELKMNIPALSSSNIEDRRGENNEIIGKLARQRTRGERMQDTMNAGAWDEQVNSTKPTKMFDDDIEATISEGRYGEYGWLDDYIEQMARIARGEK